MTKLAVVCSMALAATAAGQGTGRELLWSDPTAALPDVIISESIKYGTEGDSFYYHVKLTHPPGMREDETIDLMNDEVRVYLTSSQEVYQQDDTGGEALFEQRVGHRSQLVIDTGISVDFTPSTPAETGDRPAADLYGPIPYRYVAYSTVNPSQPSPTYGSGATATYQVVCPVCTHSAYCSMTTDIIPGTTFGVSHTVPSDTASTSFAAAGSDFDGCYQIEYKGYAPMYDKCSSGPVKADSASAPSGAGSNLVYTGYSWVRPAGVFTPATCTPNGGSAATISENLATEKATCTGVTGYTFVHTPAVGTCIDSTSSLDVTELATDSFDGTPTSGTPGTVDAAGNVEGLEDDCPAGSAWTETVAASNACVDQFGTDVYDGTSSIADTLAKCEGDPGATPPVWTDAYCTITIFDMDGNEVELVYDGDDVRGNNGQQDSSQPIDRKLCVNPAASAQTILPSPGLKSARQYTMQTTKPTQPASGYSTGYLMPEQEKGMTSHAPCRPLVTGFDGVTGIIDKVQMGGEDPAWLKHVECWDKVTGKYVDCAGSLKSVADPCAASATSCDPTAAPALASRAGISDYRIRADGSPVLRDIPRIDDYCRYCDRPGLRCDLWTDISYATVDGVVTDSNKVVLAAANAGIQAGQEVTGTGILTESATVTVKHIVGTTLLLSTSVTLTDETILTFTKSDTDILGAPTNSDGNQLSQNNDGCIKDTINGGDTAPNTENWLLPSYDRGTAGTGGPSWRGDLSSGAQLVFDSTNWATAQAVKVTIRDDNAYEPQVFGRGQDAYVHHYVVAQDINLQHTYYEDIDVNDLVVSVTDNDPALVLQEANTVAPQEGHDFHHGSTETISLRLASEPLYDVTVYVQSGPFFDTAAPTAATNFMPDDEQVVYQDVGQYEVCFDVMTGLRSVDGSHDNLCTSDAHLMRTIGDAYDDVAASAAARTVNFPLGSFDPATSRSNFNDANGAGAWSETNIALRRRQLKQRELTDTVPSDVSARTGWSSDPSGLYAPAVHACDPNGLYVRPESYKDSQNSAGGTTLGNTGTTSYHLSTGWACTGFNTEAECEADAAVAAGCTWEVQEYEWVHCSCVGTIRCGDSRGDSAYGNWPHGLGFPNAAGTRDGDICEICLDRELTAQLTTLQVIDGSGSFDPSKIPLAPAPPATAHQNAIHIYQTFCENVGTKFDDQVGTITNGLYGTADPGACLEGCNTWEDLGGGRGTCYDSAGSIVPDKKTSAACVKTGNRYIADPASAAAGPPETPQAASCVVTTTGVPVTGPAPGSTGGLITSDDVVMSQAACTGPAGTYTGGSTGFHWQATAATESCIDPEGRVVALDQSSADDCTSATDGCACTYSAAVWKGVDCTVAATTGGTTTVTEVTTSSTIARVDPHTETGCEGKATGRTWDGTSCDGDNGWRYTTEQACTGLSSYTSADGATSYVFKWRGTASNSIEGTADANQLGYCKEPYGYEADGTTPKQGSTAINGPAGETLLTATECADADGAGDPGYYNGNQYFAGAGTCRIRDDDFAPAVALSCNPDQGISASGCESAQARSPCEEECIGCPFESDGSTATLNTWIDSVGFCRSADGVTATSSDFNTKAKCENNYDTHRSSGTPRPNGRGSCVNSYTNSKSMDMVCGTWSTQGPCDNQEGCIWAGASSTCIADDLGYDCNSYLVFTSTNWNSWQTLKVIAVEDDEDETEDKPGGTDPSEIGYLYTSRDWYYNSPGSSLLAGADSAYVPDAAPWSETIEDNTGNPSVSQSSGVSPAAPLLSALSMFDTRFGTHINRYPWTLGDADIPSGVVDCSAAPAALAAEDHMRTEDGTSSWATVSQHWRKSVIDQSGHVQEPAGFIDEPHHNCALIAPHALDAMNQVCVDMDATTPPTIDGPIEQVTTFDPTEYTNQVASAQCGATANVADVNVRRVEISRYECDATEGRRYYYKDFNNQVNPTEFEWIGLYGNSRGTAGHIRGLQRTEGPTKLPTTLGLFTQSGSIQAAAGSGPADLWTTSNVLASEVSEYAMSSSKKMSMPTCPFTITLSTSPQEGTTVVVSVFEDPVISAYRDNELYFYEEPTFRPGVGKDCVDGSGNPTATCDECTTHFPGSAWLQDHDGGSCFIQNVDYDSAETHLKFQPRGGKSIDVMFTDQDWDVPRRITVIALNDDVDEPDETRVVYFDTKPCTGNNHNNDDTCHHDPLYDDALIETPTDGTTTRDTITVTVVDDDIADLVVLCGDNAGGAPTVDVGVVGSDSPFFRDSCYLLATETDCVDDSGCIWAGDSGCIFDYEDDEVFIGSYDDSHPHNRWDEFAERRGADAEDGMSYSLFGGGISTYYDGISGGGSGRLATGRSEKPRTVVQRTRATVATGPTSDTAVVLDEANEWITVGQVITGPGISSTVSAEGAVGNVVTVAAIDGTALTLSSSETIADDSVLTFWDGKKCKNCGYVSVIENVDGTQNSDEGAMTRNRCITRTVTTNTLNSLTETLGSTTAASDLGGDQEGCYPDSTVEWKSYDPYSDRYCANAGNGEKYGPHCDGTDANSIASGYRNPAANNQFLAVDQHVRGFKGVGPAITEPDSEDSYVCTIHSRECKDLLGDGVLKDAENEECEYGEFKIRLNSSPGTKKVTRQYVGVTDRVLEEELVTIVVTPDVTPQTSFSPASVTFTETGGIVDGKDTYRWDEPVTVLVVPVDDAVDERAGVIIDFTAFTVTQSHKFDEYWTYTTPYMDMTTSAATYAANGALPNVGRMCDILSEHAGVNLFGTSADCAEGTGGRIHEHTKYRHTIRTIHTMDNDYAGVRIESPNTDTSWSGYDNQKAVQSQTEDSSNPNYYTHIPVGLQATEGDTFTFYTLQLDTQPRKPQRQSGTHPNKAVVFTNDAPCYDVGDDSDGYDGPAAATPDFFNDFTDVTRPYVCGSVEVETKYWVDVTATATIHVDLASPASCPATASTPWGGGDSGGTPSRGRHPRFPFNAIDRGNGFVPFDELVDSPGEMTGYLSTCGDWQRDATYRFTADNWNVPQYVYVYAHNDKDSHDLYNAAFGVNPPSADTTTHPDFQGGNAHVRHGGNENVDASVGLDPQPWTDSDGRHEADHGDRFVTATVASGGSDGSAAVTLDAASGSDNNAGIRIGQIVTGDGISGTVFVGDISANFLSLTLSSAQTLADGVVLTFGAGNSRPTYTNIHGVPATDAYTTTIRHYVETEDTLDNMQESRFVQWNKFGGVYTAGNPERFPFGYDRVTGRPGYAKLDETGFTTWGYTQYESLYGYGYFNDGQWSTAGCCSTAMGGNWGTTTGGISIWGTGGASDTDKGQGGTDSNELGEEFMNEAPKTCRFHLTGRDATTGPSNYEAWSGRFFHTAPGASGVSAAANVGPACVEHLTGNALPRPYYQPSAAEIANGVVVPNGYPCTPVVAGQFCIPRFATSYKTNSDAERRQGHRDSTDRTTGHAMKFPPEPVYIAVKDNDRLRDQTTAEMAGIHASCRQTRLFQFADKTGSDQDGPVSEWDSSSTPGTSKTGVTRTEWLVDYNCPTNGAIRSDAGGFPGYPVSTSVPGSSGVMEPTDLTPNLDFNTAGTCADSPVGWADDYLRHGTYTGTFAPNNFESDQQELIVIVDGSISTTVQISANCDTVANCLTAIGSDTVTGATISVSGTDLLITSDTSASTTQSSSIAIDATSGTDAKALFGSPTATDGVPSPRSCLRYAESDYCDSSGAAGSGWNGAWGTISELAYNGVDATDACCACGGGIAVASGSAHIAPGDPVDYADVSGDTTGR